MKFLIDNLFPFYKKVVERNVLGKKAGNSWENFKRILSK
jgi:hypothetical protein